METTLYFLGGATFLCFALCFLLGIAHGLFYFVIRGRIKRSGDKSELLSITSEGPDNTELIDSIKYYRWLLSPISGAEKDEKLLRLRNIAKPISIAFLLLFILALVLLVVTLIYKKILF